jgi:hypothetical protein
MQPHIAVKHEKLPTTDRRRALNTPPPALSTLNAVLLVAAAVAFLPPSCNIDQAFSLTRSEPSHLKGSPLSFLSYPTTISTTRYDIVILTTLNIKALHSILPL